MKKQSIYKSLEKKAYAECIPIQASLELTHSCNQSCLHCYHENTNCNNTLLPFESISHILDELRASGTLYLTLMGGEAMLHPDFFKIAKRAHAQGFHLSMITNGALVQTQKTAKLISKYFSSITFSLYSLNSKTHELITNSKGSHKKTLNAINLCLTENIPVAINCLLNKYNIDEYFLLLDWCIEKDLVIKHDPFVTCLINGDVSNTYLRPNDKQLNTFYKNIATRWPTKLPEKKPLKLEGICCNVARMKCAIDPYGNLLGCIELREVLGNLLNEPFSKIWNNPVSKALKNSCLSNIKKDNKSFSGFYDHCMGASLNEFGNKFIIHPYLMKIAQVKDKYFKRNG